MNMFGLSGDRIAGMHDYVLYKATTTVNAKINAAERRQVKANLCGVYFSTYGNHWNSLRYKSSFSKKFSNLFYE